MRLQARGGRTFAGFGPAKIAATPLNRLRLRILSASDWEPTPAGCLRPRPALATLPESLRSLAKTAVTLCGSEGSFDSSGPERFRRYVLQYVLWLEEHYDLIWGGDVSANLPVDVPDYYTRSPEVPE